MKRPLWGSGRRRLRRQDLQDPFVAVPAPHRNLTCGSWPVIAAQHDLIAAARAHRVGLIGEAELATLYRATRRRIARLEREARL